MSHLPIWYLGQVPIEDCKQAAIEYMNIVPEDVTMGIKSVAYGNVIGLLIEAIKELDNKVDSLQKQLDEKNNDTTNN